MPDDPLKPLLDAASIDPAHLGPEEMGLLGAQVTTSLDQFILHSTRAPGLMSDQEHPPEYFWIHNRDWRIDARHPQAREFLTTLIAAAAVGDALGLDHSLQWLTTVLPTTLTVTKTSVDGNGVHLTVRRTHLPELPPDLAQDINLQDFVDFTSALANAAVAVPLPAGGTVTFADD
jgi:hypothetical protein